MNPHTRRAVSAISLLAGISLLLLAVACSSEASSSPSTPEITSTPSKSVTATATATTPIATPMNAVLTPTRVPVTATPTASAGQTGIAAIDRVLSAVAAKDAAQLASLAHFEAQGCTTAQGLGGPPGCLPGEAAGTVVDVLFTSSCDGHYIREAELSGLMTRFLADNGKLVGVYRHNGLVFPSSQYVLVYSFDTPAGSLARVLFVSDPGIVGVTFACGSSAKEYIESIALRDAILLPGG